MKNKDRISIYGANSNNLKNISVTIPRNNLVVITGLSGSGKSSLAFDISMLKVIDMLKPFQRMLVNSCQN